MKEGKGKTKREIKYVLFNAITYSASEMNSRATAHARCACVGVREMEAGWVRRNGKSFCTHLKLTVLFIISALLYDHLRVNCVVRLPGIIFSLQ